MADIVTRFGLIGFFIKHNDLNVRIGSSKKPNNPNPMKSIKCNNVFDGLRYRFANTLISLINRYIPTYFKCILWLFWYRLNKYI